MYNLFHYYQSRQEEKQRNLKEKEKNDFLRRHEKFKEQAILNRRQRLEEFVDIQMEAASPFVIPDEYFEHQSSALHKMATVSGGNGATKIFANTREKSSKSCTNTMGVGKNKLNDEFIVSKEDMKHLANSLPYQQIIDKKISGSAINFKVKADKLMKQYQHSLSKFEKARFVGRNRYRLCQITHFNQQQLNGQITKENPQIQKPRFSPVKMRSEIRKVEQSNKEQQKESVILSEIGEARVRSKTYFKLAKTTQMLTKDSIKKMKLNVLLSRSHYDRIKDVSRINGFTQWPSVSQIQSVANSVVIN